MPLRGSYRLFVHDHNLGYDANSDTADLNTYWVDCGDLWDEQEARKRHPVTFLPPNPENWKLPLSDEHRALFELSLAA